MLRELVGFSGLSSREVHRVLDEHVDMFVLSKERCRHVGSSIGFMIFINLEINLYA